MALPADPVRDGRDYVKEYEMCSSEQGHSGQCGSKTFSWQCDCGCNMTVTVSCDCSGHEGQDKEGKCCGGK